MVVIVMVRRVQETLMQVRNRLKREQAERTRKRIGELLGEAEQDSEGEEQAKQGSEVQELLCQSRQLLQQVEEERILTFLPSLCLCSPSPLLSSFFLLLPHCHPLSPMADEPWSNCILLVLVLSCLLLSLSVLALCDAPERAATARYCFVHCCLGLGLALARIMSCLTLGFVLVLCPVLSCLS